MNKDEVIILHNIFTDEELQELNDLFEANLPDNAEDFPHLGRVNVLLYGSPNFPRHIEEKLVSLVNSHRDLELEPPLELVVAPVAAEYNSKYGEPTLPPHYDGAWSDLILNFQLKANTVWPIGVELSHYTLEDNSGALFDPNANLHWRQHKNFKEGEYVRMIFFRFHEPENPKDNAGIEITSPKDQHRNLVLDYIDSLGIL